MDPREIFILEGEIAQRNAAQISALDLLTKSAKLNDDIFGMLITSELQPVILLGILEILKARIIRETWEMLPEGE